MATLEELGAALIKADAAGDTANAKILATAIQRLRAAAAAPPREWDTEAPLPEGGMPGPRMQPPAWAAEYPTAYKTAVQARQIAGPTVEMLGGALGGMAGAAAGAPTGPGAALTGAAGAGLGYGMARQALNRADVALGLQPEQPLSQQALGALKDVGTGAAFELGGRALAPVLGRVAGAVTGAGKPKPPSTEDLYKAASDAYKVADNSGALFKPESYGTFVDDLEKAITKSGLDEDLTKSSYRALARLKERAAEGAPVSLQELDTLRKVIGTAASSPVKADRSLALDMRNALDKFVSEATPASMAASDDAAIAALSQARNLYSRAAKSSDIENLVARADLSASEKATALKNEFRSLAKNPRRMRTFSPEEQEAIKDIAKGSFTGNALEFLGSLGGDATRKLVSAAVGASAGGPVGAIGMLAGEKAAQMAANKLAARQVNQLAEMIRAGKQPPMAPVQPGLQPQFAPSFLNALMSEQPLNNNALAR